MSDEKADGFDAWHDAKYPEPDEDAPYHWKVQWRGAKSERQQVWEAALSAHGLPAVDEARLDAIVEYVSEQVGYHPMAWDMVPPRAIVQSVIAAIAGGAK